MRPDTSVIDIIREIWVRFVKFIIGSSMGRSLFLQSAICLAPSRAGRRGPTARRQVLDGYLFVRGVVPTKQSLLIRYAIP
jgi:hypothetical protein